jgi:hypothetical protein
MAYFNGPTVIDPPPAPMRPYGIFDVALGPMEFPMEPAQGGGVMYVPDVCEDDVFLIQMNCPPTTGAKTFSSVEAPVSGAPFAVMTSYTCGSIGFDFAEAERRVRLRMALREQRAVERRIWQGQSNGTLGSIPGLFAGATNLGSAGCAVEAMEILEQTLADNAVVGGMIHARPGMAAHLVNNHQIVEGPGVRKRSILGTPFVFGQGYSGVGPTGQAVDGTSEWMYASGRVVIWQAPVWVPPPSQVMDRALNQTMLIAERVYAVAIECGVWAIQVTRTCTTAGGGS